MTRSVNVILNLHTGNTRIERENSTAFLSLFYYFFYELLLQTRNKYVYMHILSTCTEITMYYEQYYHWLRKIRLASFALDHGI